MKLKPEIFRYSSALISFIAIIKNELVIDIACSENLGKMFTENDKLSKKPFLDCIPKSRGWKLIEIQSKDLALYTHWPVHTQEFWDLLNEI